MINTDINDEETLTNIVSEIDEKNLNYLSTKKINELKDTILNKLPLDKTELKILKDKLNDYRYIDEIDEIKIGSFVRWIKLDNPDQIKLTNGGVIIDINPNKKRNDVIIQCKNLHPYKPSFFGFKMNKNLIFQKLSFQEKILIKIIDYLQKS